MSDNANSDEELLAFLKKGATTDIFKKKEETEVKEEETAKEKPAAKSKGSSKPRQPQAERPSARKQEVTIAMEQFEELLRKSDFFKNSLNSVKSQTTTRILEKIKEKTVQEIMNDDRIKAAVLKANMEDQIKSVDYYTYRKWLTDDLTEELKTQGGPGFYSDKGSDLYRIISDADATQLDPVLTNWLDKYAIDRHLKSRKKTGPTTFRRMFDIAQRLFYKNEMRNREIDLDAILNKVIEVTIDQVRSMIEHDDQDDKEGSFSLHFKKRTRQNEEKAATNAKIIETPENPVQDAESNNESNPE